MAYTTTITERAIVRAGYKCEGCKTKWSDLPKNERDSPIDAHSATTLHLVMDKKTGLYKVTSPPDGHLRMKNRLLRPEGFLVYKLLKREDDAFCFCNKCHKLVHVVSKKLSLARIPDKEKKNDIPFILEMATISLVLNGGKWTS